MNKSSDVHIKPRTLFARTFQLPQAAMPVWIKPQLSQLVKVPPDGPDWLHELKFDGYRTHARLDHGKVRLLTRTGLDWTRKYPAIADALKSLPVSQAYLDGELCGLRSDGTTAFEVIQNAAEPGHAAALVLYAVWWVAISASAIF